MSRMVKNCQEVNFLAVRHTSCSNSYSGTGALFVHNAPSTSRGKAT